MTTTAGETPTLCSLLERHARQQPDVVALRYKWRGLWRAHTWRAWHAGSARMAALLAATGVGPGDRVAVVLAEEIAWFHASLAVAGLGATVVAIENAVAADEVAAQVQALNCRALVARRSDLFALATSQDFAAHGRHVVSPLDLQDPTPEPSALPQGDGLLKVVIVQRDGQTLQVEEDALRQALSWGAQQPASAASALLVVGCPLVSVQGLAARLLAPLRDGRVACVPEPGIGFFETLRDVEPEVAVATSAHWEAIWRQTALRRLEAAPLHRWLFDRAARASRSATWLPRGWIQGNLRWHLGLRRCRLAVSVGAPLSAVVSEAYAAFGPALVQSDADGAVPIESDLRSIAIVRSAQTRLGAVPDEVEVELVLDLDAALRFASVHRLDCDDPASLAADEGLRRLVDAEVRQLCSRRAGPRVGRIILTVDGDEPGGGVA